MIDQKTLEMLAAKFGEKVTSSQLQQISSQLYWKVANGGLPKVSRGVYSLVAMAEASGAVVEIAPPMTKEEMSKRITERFEVLELLADGVIMGNVRSMMVSGAAGVGKTYTLEKKLLAAELKGKIKSITNVKGTVSAIGLYLLLWESRKKGQVLLVDDSDKIFEDEETLNILKHAMDTSEKRTITWYKESNALAERDVPRAFDYEGQIIFITNKNVDSDIERNTKTAPHMKALLSRAVFLDLAIHTNDQIMLRIEQVAERTSLIKDLGMTAAQGKAAIAWMNENRAGLRILSLRTLFQIASYIKTNEKQWEMLSRTTMLRKL